MFDTIILFQSFEKSHRKCSASQILITITFTLYLSKAQQI